jgi:predicted Co/Zn/Cd cation transporter (cation efflux family)
VNIQSLSTIVTAIDGETLLRLCARAHCIAVDQLARLHASSQLNCTFAIIIALTHSFAIIVAIKTNCLSEHHHNQTCALFQHNSHRDWTEQ